jgi:hypothetical protein
MERLMADDATMYLHVKIQLVRGKSAIFNGAMAEMAPVLEQHGWHLVAALTPSVGRLGAVYHVWRVPSADGVGAALAQMRAHPDSAKWHAAFAESVADEALELVHPTPYSRRP